MPVSVLKCIVVDDEPPAIKLLEGHIRKTPSLKWLKSFTNPLEALNWLAHNPVDLIFLDISMPQLNGLEFAKMMQGKTRVVLCTAYREYGADSYEYGVIDYLVKPISYTRFLNAVQKTLEVLSQPGVQEALPQTDDHFLMVSIPGRYNKYKVNFDELIYVTANKNHVAFHFEKESKMALLTLKEVEAKLPPRLFIRVHHSYIVSIRRINRMDNNTITLKNCPEIIPIGPAYKEQLFAVLNIAD